jgi:hypothetical protein
MSADSLSATHATRQAKLEIMYSSVLKYVMFFWLLDILFDPSSYSKFCINIIYFVMTYFIIRDILIMIYLFYNLHKKFE